MRSKWYDKLISFDTAHHLFAAASLGSIILVFELLGVLEWLDAGMLRVIASVSTSYHSGSSAQLSIHTPSILDIDNKIYENSFRQTSPLDRKAFGDLIRIVAKDAPKVIAIDVDVSPTVGETADQRTALDDAIASATNVSSIVLALPDPDAESSAAVFAWMKKMCLVNPPKIQFGDVVLRKRLGAVADYENGTPSLAYVAYQLASAAVNERAIGFEPKNDVTSALCENAKQSENYEIFKRRHDSFYAGKNLNSQPLNTSLFAMPLRKALLWKTNESGLIESFSPPPFSALTVFIGGSYENGDRFVTAHGVQPGLWLHAAAYSSMWSPVVRRSKTAAFFLDISFGVMFGVIVSFLWGRFAVDCQNVVDRCYKVIKHYNKAPKSQSSEPFLAGACWDVLHCFVLAWCWAALAWFALFAVTALAMFVGQSSIGARFWLNPGPMIIGMFLHSIKLQEQKEAVNEEVHLKEKRSLLAAGKQAPANHIKHDVKSWKEFFMVHPGGVVLQAPLILAGLVICCLDAMQ